MVGFGSFMIPERAVGGVSVDDKEGIRENVSGATIALRVAAV